MVLGDAFHALPPQVQAFHRGAGLRRWVGAATIRRGRGPIVHLAAALFGFPEAGEAVPTTVDVSSDGRSETWVRDFGGRILRSAQWAGTHRGERLLFERFGPIRVGAALVPEDDRLRLVHRCGSLLRIPLPTWLLPSGEAFESERDGCFCFDVTIRAPLIGLVVSYRGQLSCRSAEGDEL